MSMKALARRSAKRMLDVGVAATALAALSPLLVGVALAVARDMGRPVLFRQTRPGRDGKLFEIIKFRTMRDAYDAAGVPLPDAERLTKLGEFLRRSSLDELPELVNVLKGEMSLVGPRPLLPEYLPLYTPSQARRHELRPGITGWAQVHGRNSVTWEDRFAMDLWYVENQSLWLDLRILVQTAVAVLTQRGVSAPGHATMPRFTGTAANDPGVAA